MIPFAQPSVPGNNILKSHPEVIIGCPNPWIFVMNLELQRYKSIKTPQVILTKQGVSLQHHTFSCPIFFIREDFQGIHLLLKPGKRMVPSLIKRGILFN